MTLAGPPLYLDDLSVGQCFSSATYTLSEEAITAFATQFDPQPFHLDVEAATHSFLGGLAASGWHTAAASMRLIVGSVNIAGGVIGAGGEISWPQPARPGDELQVDTQVLEIKPSRSRPDRGVVTVRSETRNQRGETLQILTSKLIVSRKATLQV